MESADLPKAKACEPVEGAQQPLHGNTMPPLIRQDTPKRITFAEDTDLSEKQSQQTNSSYKDVLSQPAAGLSHSQRLLWLQKRRTVGLWAQCDDCDRWRFLPHVVDRHELPYKWFCSMNTDPDFASCSIPEAPIQLRDEEDLIHSEYTAGSVVWARLAGWPWWPAMVDDCPDVEQFYWLDGFSDIPTHYNVVFFDKMEVTRAWISPNNMKPYAANKNSFKYLLKNKKYNQRLTAAMAQADEAEQYTVAERLHKYSFISRHTGHINSPKKVNLNDLKKYQRRFKNKFNIEFPIESDSDEDLVSENAEKNVVPIFRTPKRARKEKNLVSITQKITITDTNTIMELSPDINKEQTQTVNNEPPSSKQDTFDANIDKPDNSMLPQVGSTEATSIDNDTSTTYLPANGSERQVLSIDMETPNSDDFDF